MEGYQWGGGEGRRGEKVQGIRSISGRYKIDKGWLSVGRVRGRMREKGTGSKKHK